jgi:hypothetical protein
MSASDANMVTKWWTGYPFFSIVYQIYSEVEMGREHFLSP